MLNHLLDLQQGNSRSVDERLEYSHQFFADVEKLSSRQIAGMARKYSSQGLGVKIP